MAPRATFCIQNVAPCVQGRSIGNKVLQGYRSFGPLRPVGGRTPHRLVIVAAEDTPQGTSSSKKVDVDVDKIFNDLQDKWENVEDKSAVVTYGVGAVAALWIASSLVNAFSGIPLLPKLFELIGLIYASWFVYRYLLFKSSREELIQDVEDLKKKITGTEE